MSKCVSLWTKGETGRTVWGFVAPGPDWHRVSGPDLVYKKDFDALAARLAEALNLLENCQVRRWDLDRHAESAPRWVVAASAYDALEERLAEWKDLANKHFHTIGELEKRLAEADEQIAALQAKVHLCAAYDRIEKRLAEAERLLRGVRRCHTIVVDGDYDGRGQEHMDRIDAFLADQPSEVRHED